MHEFSPWLHIQALLRLLGRNALFTKPQASTGGTHLLPGEVLFVTQRHGRFDSISLMQPRWTVASNIMHAAACSSDHLSDCNWLIRTQHVSDTKTLHGWN